MTSTVDAPKHSRKQKNKKNKTLEEIWGRGGILAEILFFCFLVFSTVFEHMRFIPVEVLYFTNVWEHCRSMRKGNTTTVGAAVRLVSDVAGEVYNFVNLTKSRGVGCPCTHIII